MGAVRGREGVGSVTTALNTYPTSHQPRQANATPLQLRLQFHEIKEAKPTMDTSLFQTVKLIIVSATGLSKDALHIHVGMTIYLALVVIIRRCPFYTGWAAVLVMACAGEWLDARDDIATFGYWRWEASMQDLLNTLFWPTVLTLGWMMKIRCTDSRK